MTDNVYLRTQSIQLSCILMGQDIESVCKDLSFILISFTVLVCFLHMLQMQRSVRAAENPNVMVKLAIFTYMI